VYKTPQHTDNLPPYSPNKDIHVARFPLALLARGTPGKGETQGNYVIRVEQLFTTEWQVMRAE